MDKYSLSMSEACTFLGVSRPTLAQMIHSGRLAATRKNPSKKQSPYLITRQACIAALNNPIHTVAVSAAEKHEEKPCPSSAEVKSGMQVSRNQAANVLRKVLAQKTNAKRRSCTTDERPNCGE